MAITQTTLYNGTGTTFVSDNLGFAPGTVYTGVLDGAVTYDIDANNDGNLSDGEKIVLNPGQPDEIITSESTSAKIQIVTATLTFSDGTTATWADNLRGIILSNGDVLWQVSTFDWPEDYSDKTITSFTITDSWQGGTWYGQIQSSGMVPCFGRGTYLETGQGQALIENLCPGDHLQTLDGKLREIKWIGKRHIEASELAEKPRLQPIRVRAGALGPGYPSTDTLVSPQHRLLVASRIARRVMQSSEVLVAAKHLLGVEGIEIAQDVTEITYFHVLLEDHEIVLANDMPAESLYFGNEVRKMMSPESLREILEILPELHGVLFGVSPRPARPLATGRSGKEIAKCHNRKMLALLAA